MLGLAIPFFFGQWIGSTLAGTLLDCKCLGYTKRSSSLFLFLFLLFWKKEKKLPSRRKDTRAVDKKFTVDR